MVIWINDDRTMLVRSYQDAEYPRRHRLEVCTREDSDAVWGPPVEVKEERTLRG